MKRTPKPVSQLHLFKSADQLVKKYLQEAYDISYIRGEALEELNKMFTYIEISAKTGIPRGTLTSIANRHRRRKELRQRRKSEGI